MGIILYRVIAHTYINKKSVSSNSNLRTALLKKDIEMHVLIIFKSWCLYLILCFWILFIYLIHLFERLRDREWSLIYHFAPKMPTWTKAGQAEGITRNSGRVSNMGGRNSTTWHNQLHPPGCTFAGSWNWEQNQDCKLDTEMGMRLCEEIPNNISRYTCINRSM